jgi:hypothetical protein
MDYKDCDFLAQIFMIIYDNLEVMGDRGVTV